MNINKFQLFASTHNGQKLPIKLKVTNCNHKLLQMSFDLSLVHSVNKRISVMILNSNVAIDENSGGWSKFSKIPVGQCFWGKISRGIPYWF